MHLLAKNDAESLVGLKNDIIAIHNKSYITGIKDSLKHVIAFFKREAGVVIIVDIHTYTVPL